MCCGKPDTLWRQQVQRGAVKCGAEKGGSCGSLQRAGPQSPSSTTHQARRPNLVLWRSRNVAAPNLGSQAELGGWGEGRFKNAVLILHIGFLIPVFCSCRCTSSPGR